ncbi:uncharacterized protein I303_102021 [Kwoniella dejecticola CBS 10117]|uniref:F-box domain-containing protein n=1 Tax=Kwoniella dejecticola CBS 10117 TaxID=1296121 RepID=A0A1A6AC65_9TREE|nr:uncharacterized protein I303_01841 [Kwoniella dejecticola CBS 10117]OBR87633.1 hypothetical protein I303_01841 [Kwoniella dejecticola CBS 10117]
MAPSKKKSKIRKSSRKLKSVFAEGVNGGSSSSGSTLTKQVSELQLIRTPPSAQITDLPDELIHHIFSYFSSDTTSLLKCSTVSRQWHQAASSSIWQHLTLTPWSKEKDENGAPLANDAHQYFGQIATTQRSQRSTTDQVRKFTLHHHTSEWCKAGKGQRSSTFKLPNLDILEIYFDGRWKFPRLHAKPDSPTSKTRYTGGDCRLLQDIYPRIIVFKCCTAHCHPLCVPGLPTSLFRHVEELIFVSSDVEHIKPGKQILGAPEFPLGQLKSITWIFAPEWNNFAGTSNLSPSLKFIAQCLFPMLFTHPQTSDLPITIVNPAQQSCQAYTTREAIEMIKSDLTKQATKVGFSETDIVRRLSEVSLVSMKAWAMSEDKWEGTLEKGDVLRWSNRIERMVRWNFQ